jgi:glycine cleavage system H protein
MSHIPTDLMYTKDHEWLKKSSTPKVVVVGVTDFAQAALGDVTFLQLPDLNKVYKKGDVFGTVESVKAVSDLYAPVSGRISKINQDLVNDPAPINTDPYGKAWMVEFELENENELQQLLNAQAYTAHAQ